MTKIRVSTDSTADIPRELAEELQITVIPMSILADGKEYLDGVDLQPAEFYELLENCSEIPTTSQVSTQRYQELFYDTWKAGFSHLIHTTINSRGSGTYQAAVLSRELFYEEYPEAKQEFSIELIDSMTYSMLYGWGVVEGARLARDGAEPQQVVDAITDWCRNSRAVFVPMNLRFVRKSGRVSAAAAFVGDAMGLKPAITFENGASKVLTKFRGDKKVVPGMMDMMRRERKPGTPYFLVYGTNREQYEALQQACADEMEQPPELCYSVGNIISINTGPNMIAVIYRR